MNNKVNFRKAGFKPLVCVAVLSLQLLGSSFAQNPGGTYGSLTWELRLSDSTLTIDGNDTMPNSDYGSPDPPWWLHRMLISKVVIKDGVKSIGSWAFSGCPLVSATIGNSVTTINNNAFTSCYGLKFVSIGNSVTVIGEGTFNNSPNLDSIICYANIPPIIVEKYKGSVFSHTPITIPIYVPCGSIAAYQAAEGWGIMTISGKWEQFTNYQVIGYPPNSFPSPNDISVLQQGNVLEISWQNTGALSYKIYRNHVLLTTVSTTTYVDSNLANGNYCYKIKAIYELCESGFSREVCKIVSGVDIKQLHLQDYELQVFPNPVNYELKITNYEGGVVEIYNVVGQLLYQINKSTNKQINNEISIDVSHLAVGMYFLKVDNKVVRFVKE